MKPRGKRRLDGNREELHLHEAKRSEVEMEVWGGERRLIGVPSGEFSDGSFFPILHELRFVLNLH